MNAESIKSCPKCHAPIPPEAPQGLCPKCLLAGAAIATEAGQSAAGAPPPSLETVAAAFPQLEILEFIGQGGMGVVFKARQPRLDRFVALKLLPQKPGADPAFNERFSREARLLARLSHPNIVAVHDYGQADPFSYLVMEFVDGVNLRQAMRAERFTPAQALALVPKICDALQYAHEEGVLHRDIKPENLLLDTRGRLKIADFGIAKLLGGAEDITLTASGATLGTPHYMAPEQLERPQDVDQRADIYSLGVVFYEMLTGELPIGRFAPPSEKAPMDPRVDEVVLRALEKERERRFQSAGDVKTQVEKITAGPVPTEAGPTGTVSLGTGGGPPPQSPFQANPPATASPRPSGWSIAAITAAGLVGLSLLPLVLALLAGGHIGPGETAFMSVVAGFPAVGGTLLAWLALRDFRAKPGERRGGRLALCSAVAWPLLLLDVVLLWIPLLFFESLQWHVFHVRHGFLTGLAAVGGVLALLVLDVFVLRHLLKRWNSERALPDAVLQAPLNRFPRRALWFWGVALGVLLLVLWVGHERMMRVDEPAQASFVPEPNAPAGYEVAAGGGTPGGDSRVFRSTVTIPPGYALTVAAVLCSNQVVLKPGPPNAAASVMAPEGTPIQGRLTWRLLGNRTFADGAPLQLSLGLEGEPDNADKSFHIVPPEPVAIDWVGEPARVWPPQNGHTKFLLLKGSSSNPGAEAQPPTEWAVGIETRLDPIPADLLRNLKNPVIGLGTNWLSTLGNAPTTPAGSTNPLTTPAPEATAAIPPEKLAEYKTICSLIEELASQERELLVQLTPENPVVKSVRDRIASKQKIKQQLEEENPGLALLKTGQIPSQVPEK
ncbi:MAG: serine/threonine-protein kinase [Verrucomicrobiota bacterium]|jgi:tRNA A-37 threonylcarbamoyl transferase component Bud32/uncharacterized membrane protein